MAEIKIIAKKEAPLLLRTEVAAEATYGGAVPKKEEVSSKIASLLSAKESLVVVKKIQTKFGQKKAAVYAYVYNDEKSRSEIEPKKRVKKGAAEAEQKAEEKPAEKKAKAE